VQVVKTEDMQVRSYLGNYVWGIHYNIVKFRIAERNQIQK
jgi:hypothetical protein